MKIWIGFTTTVAMLLSMLALLVSLTHAGPIGAPGRMGATGLTGPTGPQGSPGVAQTLDGGYTSECSQPMGANSTTYYYPCSPVPQNPADQ